MKTALIFGGTGWVGHRIALAFKNAGYQVAVGTRGHKEEFADRLGGIERIIIDKKSDEQMKELFKRSFDVVVDSVPGAVSIESIQRYAKGLKHYIHCSSTGGYAPLPFIPCDETAPYLGFESGTGWAQKVEVDNLAMELFGKCGFPATVIRPCYITGGSDRLPIDNLGGRREDFIPDIIAGKTLDLPDNGLALLQPIHVDDLAHSFLLAAETSVSIAQRYNICLDHAVTLNRYIELNAQSVGCQAKINYMSVPDMLAKYGDSISAIGLRFLASHMCFTNAKARRDLGFVPAHTPEETICETAKAAAARVK